MEKKSFLQWDLILFVSIFILTISPFLHALEITYTYDNLNRVTSVAYKNGGSTTTATHEYDTAGNITRSAVAGASDMAGPSLSITSHGDNQHVTTAAITLSGTATDSEKGDNGISQVTVNGVRAANDTAAGAATANWSRSVTLTAGANAITVIAYDNSSSNNSTSQTITVNYDPLPIVKVTAPVSIAKEAGQVVGKYRIERTGVTTSALSISFAMSGSATNGTDYTSITSPVTIPAGQSFVEVTLTPTDDTANEGNETAVLTLSANTAYDIDSQNSSATITIEDNDKPTVTVTAPDATAKERGLDTGTYRISRTGSTDSTLTVNFALSGQAICGTDYSLQKGSTALSCSSGNATIDSGSSSVDISLTPKADSLTEGSETAILTLSANSAYDIGSPNSAMVTIEDDAALTGAPISWGSSRIAALFSDYGSDSGIWSHNGSSWSRLTDWQPAQMIGYGTTGIMASFNDYSSGNGLYRYDGSAWSRLTDWVPSDMVAYTGGNIAGKFSDYGSDGNGIWRYNGSWTRLTDWTPDLMTTLDNNTLVGKFSNYGSGNGIYKHDGSSWSRLTDWLPDGMSAWGSRLTAVFTNYSDSGNGLWIYENSSWRRATDWQPAKVLSWKSDTLLAGIFSNYSSGNGLYSYNGSSWTRLTDWIPADMAKLGTEDLAAVFKDYGTSGNGIWKYTSGTSSWQRLTDWVPEKISSSGDYITAVFTNQGSSGNGVWKYQGGGWIRLTDWTPKAPEP